MTNVRKIRELFNYNQNEGNEEYDSEDDYQDQYLKSTQIDEDKKYEDEEPRIKINLEEIEERAPEEEESCISSLILSKEYQKSPKKYVNNILILRKLLKYKNILYYYFMRWKRLSNNVSLTKNFKILKRKQRMPMNEYIIGDAIITNDSIDSDKNDDNIKNSYNSEIRKEKILKNLKFFIEFNKSKKSIKKKYINRWREFVLKKEHEIEEIEQKYKNENLNIFENNNDIDDNYNNSIFNDNNFQSGTQRKELNVKKNEVINSKVNKEVRKSFRIGTVNNNFIIKFEDPENGNSISNTNLNNDNKKKEEKKEDNGSTNLNNNKNEENKNNNKLEKEKIPKPKTGEKIKKKKDGKIIKKKKIKTKKNNHNELKKAIEKINRKKLLKMYFKKWFKNSRNNILHSSEKKTNINTSDTQSKDSFSEKSIKNKSNKNSKSSKNIYNGNQTNKKIKKIKNKDDKSSKKEEKSNRKKKVNIVEDYYSTGYDNEENNFQHNKEKENANNSLVPKNFKKSEMINQNKSFSPSRIKKYDQEDDYSISNSNNDYSNDNYVQRKKSYVIEEEPVQVRQRRYTNGEKPEVQEHTVRMIRLTDPIKEIKDGENGNLEIRLAGEFIEFGTEITRYPSEITETITTTTRIISEDTGNENKVYNTREEEITYQGKTFKRIINTVEEEPSNSSSQTTRKLVKSGNNFNNFISTKILGNDEINEKLNNYNDLNNNNNWNIMKKNKSQRTLNTIINKSDKNQNNNALIKESEPSYIENKRNNNELQNELYFDNFPRDDNSNNYLNNSQKKIPKKKINIANDQIQYSETKKESNYNTLRANELENRPSLHSNKSNTSDNLSVSDKNQDSIRKDNKIKDKDKKNNSDKKKKKLFKKYNKGFHFLRKLIRNRKKRNKNNFIPDIKKRYYFDIWVNNVFPDGLESFRQKKNLGNKNNSNSVEAINNNSINNSYKNNINKKINNSSGKKKNLKVKEKIIKIIDMIRIHRKRSRKLKIKLKEKKDLEKLSFCLNLWKKNIFSIGNDKNEDDDDILTYSSMNGNDYYNEKNKNLINRSSINSNNSILSNTSNNIIASKKSINNANNKKTSKNNEKENTKKTKKRNDNRRNIILKKYINLKEKKTLYKYLKKWNNLIMLEKSLTIPYTKPKFVHLNEIQSPLRSESNTNNSLMSSVKMDIKDEMNINENDNKINIKSKSDEKIFNQNSGNNNIITINTNLDKPDKTNVTKNNKNRHLKPEDKEEFNEEYEGEEEEEEEEDDDDDNDKKNQKINNIKLNSNYYTRISDIENRAINNIKNGVEKNGKNLKIILINLFNKINNKKILYFYFIKWHNYILLKDNYIRRESSISPKKIISKVMRQFYPENNNNKINNNLRKTLTQQTEEDILDNSELMENLPFLHKSQKRIVVRNELSFNKKRSKTLLTRQNIGNMSINRYGDYDNNFDEENISENFKYIIPMKHLSNVNINSEKKRILRKKIDSENNSNEKHIKNNNVLVNENTKKNIKKTHKGDAISKKNKKLEDNKSPDKSINSKDNNIKKINISKLDSNRNNNNQKKEKKEIKKNKKKEKDTTKENQKEKDKILNHSIYDMSEKSKKMMNDNANIMENNANINLINIDIKEKYLSFLKKNYKIMGTYRLFYLYSLFNERSDYFKLRNTFKKWKKNIKN